MLIPRLAVLIALIALFAAGATRLAAPSANATEKSRTPNAGQCPVNRQIGGAHCACGGQSAIPATSCLPPRSKLRPRVETVVSGRDRHSDNCVFFVRARVRSLPYGLGTWTGKLAIINARVPRRGDVAIIKVGGGPYRDVGHVAIIEQVTANTLTILEANFYAGRVSRRTATGANARETAALLGIAGYFRP